MVQTQASYPQVRGEGRGWLRGEGLSCWVPHRHEVPDLVLVFADLYCDDLAEVLLYVLYVSWVFSPFESCANGACHSDCGMC